MPNRIDLPVDGEAGPVRRRHRVALPSGERPLPDPHQTPAGIVAVANGRSAVAARSEHSADTGRPRASANLLISSRFFVMPMEVAKLDWIFLQLAH